MQHKTFSAEASSETWQHLSVDDCLLARSRVHHTRVVTRVEIYMGKGSHYIQTAKSKGERGLPASTTESWYSRILPYMLRVPVAGDSKGSGNLVRHATVCRSIDAFKRELT